MTRQSFAGIPIAALLVSTGAQAGDLPSDKLQMVCKGNTAEYVVQYDEAKHRFIVKRDGQTTNYKVRTVEIGSGRIVIRGQASDKTRRFEADMGINKSMRYIAENGEQTHSCR